MKHPVLARSALALASAVLATSLSSAQMTGARVIALDRGLGIEPPKLWPVAACRLRTPCELGPPMSVHTSPRGGTTYDSGRDGFWSSDGRDIVFTTKACSLKCSYRIADAMADVTGLAINRRRGWLYSSHSDNVIRAWSGLDGCKLQLVTSCAVKMTFPAEMVTGIEFDSRIEKLHPNGRLFCVTTAGYLIALAEPAPNVCKEICRVTLPSCNTTRFTTWTGLTYDPSRRYLFFTDGKSLLTLKEQGDGCILSTVECCIGLCGHDNCYEWTGLAWQSGELVLDPGTKPCTDVTCGCPPVLGGDGVPSVLNPSFKVTLDKLQPVGISVVLLSLGDTTSGLPVGCGRVYLPFTPLLLTFPAIHSGSGACAATAALPMGFFPPATAGMRFSVQAATLCPTTKTTGLALSAAARLDVGW